MDIEKIKEGYEEAQKSIVIESLKKELFPVEVYLAPFSWHSVSDTWAEFPVVAGHSRTPLGKIKYNILTGLLLDHIHLEPREIIEIYKNESEYNRNYLVSYHCKFNPNTGEKTQYQTNEEYVRYCRNSIFSDLVKDEKPAGLRGFFSRLWD